MKRLRDLGLLRQIGVEWEVVVIETVIPQSKSVLDTRLERGRLQNGDDVLERSLRRSVDEIPTTTLAMLHVTGLGQKEADSCVQLSDIKAEAALNARRSFVERNRLASGSKPPELCLNDAVGKVGCIVEACSEDTDNK